MTKPNITPKGYERKVAARLRKVGYTVLRADHANYMPDFIYFKKGSIGFVECKRYLSVKCPFTVIERIKVRQAKQWARMKELSYATLVELHIMVKGGKEHTFGILNGQVFGYGTDGTKS